MIVTKKIKLKVVGDKKEVNRVYSYIRDACYAQNSAYNYLMSVIFSSYKKNESNETRKELYKLGGRNKGTSKDGGSLYDELDNINFPPGLGIAGTVSHAVRQDMQAQIKAGLMKGKISLRNKKLDAPLMINSARFIEFYTPYETEEEIFDKYNSPDFEVFIKFVNNIHFQIIFGSPYRSGDLRSSILKILTGEYKACGSSIQIKDKKLFLNLSVDIGKKEPTILEEDSVIGCHIGFSAPIVCYSTKTNRKITIGETESFVQQRVYLQEQRRILQKQLKSTSGGHGRKKKLAKLENCKKRESNFAKTVNHQWSAAIIKTALEHNAKYINLEVIKSKDLNKYILRNWSYYQLQNYIKYKAEKEGIVVRFVDTKDILKDVNEADNIDVKDVNAEIDKNISDEEKMLEIINEDTEISKKLAFANKFVKEKDIEKIEEQEQEEE